MRLHNIYLITFVPNKKKFRKNLTNTRKKKKLKTLKIFAKAIRYQIKYGWVNATYTKYKRCNKIIKVTAKINNTIIQANIWNRRLEQ